MLLQKHLEERETTIPALVLLRSSGKTSVPSHHLPSEQISKVVDSLFACNMCKIRIRMTTYTYNCVFKICVQLGLSLKVNLPGDITSSAYIKYSVKMQPGFGIKFHALKPGLQLAHLTSVPSATRLLWTSKLVCNLSTYFVCFGNNLMIFLGENVPSIHCPCLRRLYDLEWVCLRIIFLRPW